ncbi:hypothetical protein Q4Q39_06445 [Flavivirga amylovorans]|uniref:DUF3570 domain-containing protein n=1 Tax=Flavivirga amylovorans TaxID=870486 RepID=A0ABT8WZD7_9FLAO|nr:hypothetical protein [Flavivirga amylovorans]MDO5987045.1 hypothetical protein [Flavivirga amylovorans]
MKYLKIITGVILVMSQIQAQSQIKLEAGTQAGYEYNYFKSPDQVRFNGMLLDENDLIASSIYQEVNIDFENRIKWNRSKLRLIAKPNIKVFYENLEDSYWDITGQAKYYHDLSRYTTLLGEASIIRMNREGLDGAQDVIVNPLGYTNVGASIGVQFEPIEANKTTVKAFYNFRDYDAYGERDLQYNEAGVNLSTKQDLEVNGSEHSIGVLAYFKVRKYDTFNATNIISNGVRDWSYLKINPYYKVPLGNNLEAKPSFVFYQRMDKIDRSGFSQFGPELKLKYEKSNTEITTDFSYLNRHYKSIEARDNDGLIGDKLTYEYIEFNLSIAHKLSNNLFLTANIYSRLRHTNYTDIDARSFRGYRNQYAGLGIKWKL